MSKMDEFYAAMYEDEEVNTRENNDINDLICETGSALNQTDDNDEKVTSPTAASVEVGESQETSQENLNVVDQETSQQSDNIGFNASGTGQLSLFDWDDEPAPKNEAAASKEDKKTKPSTTKTTKSAVETSGSAPVKKDSKVTTKPKIDKITIGAGTEWQIRYAGATYMVNLLMEEEINTGVNVVTLEDIRKKMITAEGCIELSPKRTQWNVDEPQQLLVLICKGEDKGGLV